MSGRRDDYYSRKNTEQTASDYEEYSSRDNYGRSNNRKPQKQPSRAPPAGSKIQKQKRKSSLKKGIIVFFIVGLLLFAVFFTPLIDYISGPWGGPVYPKKAEFDLTRTVRISTDEYMEYNMDVPKPPDDISTSGGYHIQSIEDIDWGSPDPSNMYKYGENWKVWEGELESHQTLTLEFTYRSVTTRTIDWGYSAENSGTTEDLPQERKEQYIKDQWVVDRNNDGQPDDRDGDGRGDVMIEPSHPEIQSYAEEITAGKDNIYSKARAIYNWINRNIDYQSGGTGQLPQHSIQTLRRGSGDCDEQSFLFCSLARAVDIPASIELGVLYDRFRDYWGGHGWVRLWFTTGSNSGAGWVNIDPVNKQFFARGAKRLTTWVDDGEDGHLKDYYIFLNYTYRRGQRPVLEKSDRYSASNMETSGEVVLDGDNSIPGMGLGALIPAVTVSLLTYQIVKRKRDN